MLSVEFVVLTQPERHQVNERCPSGRNDRGSTFQDLELLEEGLRDVAGSAGITKDEVGVVDVLKSDVLPNETEQDLTMDLLRRCCLKSHNTLIVGGVSEPPSFSFFKQIVRPIGDACRESGRNRFTGLVQRGEHVHLQRQIYLRG